MRLTKKGFCEWLKSKDPAEVVGRPRIQEACPIATYLNETTGEIDWHVDGDHYANLRHKRKMPPWASDFVLHIDGFKHRVSASKALKILGEVT